KKRTAGLDWKRVEGGFLVQEKDYEDVSLSWEVVTERRPTQEEEDDLRFALKVVKHVKSNAIVLAKGKQTVGIGAGQMSRVAAVRLAVNQAGDNSKGSVLASDAFFPFKDAVEIAVRNGVTAIVHPGGSLRDDDSIAVCNQYQVSMVITGRRFFKH
ncbi:MAG: bifunctional phosphoribosylaminoimidazolecarboxamide formyltransferase/IMP cyclohydrolase, partial [Firmicutes bacterium]|nr:bifunctional phosphoribosylaminoimidazolecarboxamide formyltransferase/IMP cyclohydrolase [Bacillota bacterium]